MVRSALTIKLRQRESMKRTRAKFGGAAAYRNKWRNESEEEKKKYLAHKTVESNLASGKLKRQPCERCGNKNTHAHHEDYSKPLEVNWLCPKCHKARHREIKKSRTIG